MSADLCIRNKGGTPAALGEYRAFLLIYEWWSKVIFIYLLRKRGEAQHRLLDWLHRAENKHGRIIGHVHIDKGEMDATKVANFLAEPHRMGQLHMNQRGAHEHNPYAEIKI